jgi:hypothetical protein
MINLIAMAITLAALPPAVDNKAASAAMQICLQDVRIDDTPADEIGQDCYRAMNLYALLAAADKKSGHIKAEYQDVEAGILAELLVGAAANDLGHPDVASDLFDDVIGASANMLKNPQYLSPEDQQEVAKIHATALAAKAKLTATPSPVVNNGSKETN